jgi:hypothetical protein
MLLNHGADPDHPSIMEHYKFIHKYLKVKNSMTHKKIKGLIPSKVRNGEEE